MPVYIDDSDLSKVTFKGNWTPGGSQYEFDHTVSSSVHVGDSFTISFRGTQISVFGTFDSTSEGVITNYSIDGRPPVQAVSSSGSGDTFKQQFWKSPLLTPGNHTLTATMAKLNVLPDDPSEGTIWFDYFLVIDPSITSTVGLPTNTGSPTPSGNQQIGAIIGGVLGGLFLLLTTIFLFLFYRRHRRSSPVATSLEDKRLEFNSSIYGHSPSRPFSVEPFLLTVPSHDPSMLLDFDPSRLVAPGPPVQPSRKPAFPSGGSRRPATAETSTSGLASAADGPSSSSNPSDPPLPVDRELLVVNDDSSGGESMPRTRATADKAESSRVHRHIDSGIRAPATSGQNRNTVELPPVYSPL